MSLVSVQSSNPTSLIETKSQIILKHLGNLDEKILESFKKALCQLKPRRGAGPIRMGNLKDKSLKEIVQFIFKCHTEKRGAETVKMTLAKINENQTRMLMERELRAAMQRRKSMETEKKEASTSNVMVHKQDGKQVHNIIPNFGYFICHLPTAQTVPCSEPSAKTMKREPGRDPVLGTPTNREATTSKNDGRAHNPLKPASTSNVHKQDGKQVYNIIPNIVGPTARAVPCSEPSAHKIKREPGRDPVLGTPTNREATTSKNEGRAHNPLKPASTSNVMVHKQDGKQVYNIIPNIGNFICHLPTAQTVPCSEPSTKTIKREHDSDVVLEIPTNKQATASKNEGPAHRPPKPASTSNVHKQDGKQVYNIIPNIVGPTANAVPCSEPSAHKIKREPGERDPVLGTPTNREATTSKNEGPAHYPPKPASTSNVMVHKQDGKQVHTNIPNIVVPTTRAVPCSDPSSKKLRRESDSDAVLEIPTNKQTASKNEGPAHNPPKPASPSKVMVDKQDWKQVHTSTHKIVVPIGVAVPCSEFSAHKMKREPDRDAVLGTPTNREAIARKNEGPAHYPPKPAATSNVMVNKQDGKQGYNIITNFVGPTAHAVPCSEPSAHKIKREQDRDAVLGTPTNREATTSKNEGPGYNPPKPASTSNVMVHKQDGKQVYNIIPNIGVPTTRPVACSEPSAKKIRRDSGRDAVLGTPMNKQATANKNEGPSHNPPKPAKKIRRESDRDAVLGTPTNKQATESKIEGPAHNPPKPASTSNVHKQDGKQVYTIIPNIGVPTARAVPCSEPSAKKIRRESNRDAVGVPENKEATTSKNEGPAHNPPKPGKLHSEKAPPSISIEKKTSNIIVKHLKTLKEGDIEKFKEILCSEKPPIKNGEIQMSDIEDKSLEEMVDLVIRCHTLRHGPATVRKVLELMKENQIKMLMQKDIRTLNQQQKKKVRDR